MYLTRKMCKSPFYARFIVASKIYSTKPLTEAVYKVFKLIFTKVNCFHEESFSILTSPNLGC